MLSPGWTGNNALSATGAVSVVSSSSTFYITGVQLEKGTTASAFSARPYGQEMSLCERYFEKTQFVSFGAGYTSVYPQATYRQQKRATPTMTFDTTNGVFNPGLSTFGFYQNGANTLNNVNVGVCYSDCEL